MKNSEFQFSNPNLTKLNFEINSEFMQNTSNPIKFNITPTVTINKDGKEPFATVSLNLKIGECTPDYPFWINITETALFCWSEQLSDIDRLLSQNAPALLLSYMRPIISTITAASKYSAYNLPYINFTEN